LFGLSLANSKIFKVNWAAVISEMVAFALLTYGLIVNQLEWLMTPPRSELWAACLGASVALLWYIIRNRQEGALRIAIWSALGAGFGFAFGNFLQVLGASSPVNINFWNVMEYSIGFFGGLGMAYGTLTSSWPEQETVDNRMSNLVPILFLAAFIPFVLWDQSFVTEKLTFIIKEGGTEDTVLLFQILAGISIAVFILTMLARYWRSTYTFSDVRSIFLISILIYTFLSFLLTGIYSHPIEQYLYIVNIGLILFLVPSVSNNFEVIEEKPSNWIIACVLCVLVVGLFAMIAINSHSEIPGMEVRFE
jgi:hypothetical protein